MLYSKICHRKVVNLVIYKYVRMYHILENDLGVTLRHLSCPHLCSSNTFLKKLIDLNFNKNCYEYFYVCHVMLGRRQRNVKFVS